MAVPDPYKAASNKIGYNLAKSSYVPDPVKAPTIKMSPAPPAAKTPQIKMSPAPPKPLQPVEPQSVPAPATSPVQPDLGPYQDWKTKTDALFSKLEGLTNQQFTYDPNTDPAYQAQRQLAQLRAGDASKQAMEIANEKGILGSSMTGESLAQIQQRAEQEAASYIPQYREQAYGQFQDRLQNAGSLLRTASDLRGYDDNLAMEKANITGTYLDPDAESKINRIIELGEAWNTGSPEQQAQYHQEAESLRSELQGMGIDPSLFGADKTTEQRTANIGKAGVQTLVGQNQQFNQDVTETELMARLTGHLPDGTPTNEKQQKDLDNAWNTIKEIGYVPASLAQIVGVPVNTKTQDAIKTAIAQQNANTSSFSAQTSRQNVEQDQSKVDQQKDMNAQQAQIMDGIAQFDTAAEASAWLNANAKSITESLGADTFSEMKKMLPLFFGEDTSGDQAASTQKLRQQATDMAQKDLRWKNSKQDKEALIQEYMKYLTGS